MQPAFLPWQGFFGLVAAADVFVLLDDFQFQRHSFHQRNRVRAADGTEAWITLPVAHPAAGSSRRSRPRHRSSTPSGGGA